MLKWLMVITIGLWWGYSFYEFHPTYIITMPLAFICSAVLYNIESQFEVYCKQKRY